MTIASLVATGVLDWEGLEMVRKVRSQCYLLGQEAGVGVHVCFCLRMKSLSKEIKSGRGKEMCIPAGE